MRVGTRNEECGLCANPTDTPRSRAGTGSPPRSAAPPRGKLPPPPSFSAVSPGVPPPQRGVIDCLSPPPLLPHTRTQAADVAKSVPLSRTPNAREPAEGAAGHSGTLERGPGGQLRPMPGLLQSSFQGQNGACAEHAARTRSRTEAWRRRKPSLSQREGAVQPGKHPGPRATHR